MSKTIEERREELKQAIKRRDAAASRALVARKVTERREADQERERWRLEVLRLERLIASQAAAHG